eukprot:1482030-Prymnesium_polylepis.1
MAKRPSTLLRGSGELLVVLDRYLDASISTSDKRKRVVKERDLLATMEDITNEVLGRPADDSIGRTKKSPTLVKSYDLINAEVENWRTKCPDKVLPVYSGFIVCITWTQS